MKMGAQVPKILGHSVFMCTTYLFVCVCGGGGGGWTIPRTYLLLAAHLVYIPQLCIVMTYNHN